ALDCIERQLADLERQMQATGSSSLGAKRRGNPRIVGLCWWPLDCFAPLAMTASFPSQGVPVQRSKDHGDHGLDLPPRAVLRGDDVVVAASENLTGSLPSSLMIRPNE